MKDMTLRNLAEVCGGEYIGQPQLLDKEIAGVVIDSRLVEKDYAFIAVQGERVDGHDYINAAFEKGACLAISEKKIDGLGNPYILVESALQALKDVAEFYRKSLKIKVVGITGSVGKTSTKEVVATVLEQKYKVLKTQGNFNNEIGLPLTILSIRQEHEIAVVEMGISDRGEMRRLSKIARPDICVITNIGLCHLENLKNREGILKAKSEIFEYMNPDGEIILNGDDDMLSTIKNVNGIVPKRFGFQKTNDVYGTNVDNHGLEGSSFAVHNMGEIYQARTMIPGSHMVLNAICAVLVGDVLGLSQKEIVRGIATVKSIDGRSHLIRTECITLIDDSYNANPVSMKEALNLLSLSPARKVAILGDMGELGEDEDLLHGDVGRYAGEKEIDLLICVGEKAALIRDGAREKLPTEKVIYFRTKEEVIPQLTKFIEKGDSILVKASHFMRFEDIVSYFVNHDCQASAE